MNCPLCEKEMNVITKYNHRCYDCNLNARLDANNILVASFSFEKIYGVAISFDPKKRISVYKQIGLSFNKVLDFDFVTLPTKEQLVKKIITLEKCNILS